MQLFVQQRETLSILSDNQTMSQDQDVSLKTKRADRDAQRHKAGKKRKHQAAEDGESVDPPAKKSKHDEFATGEEFVSLPTEDARDATKSASSSKKRKRAPDSANQVEAASAEPVATPKPQKKPKSISKPAAGDSGDAEPAQAAIASPTKQRFIVFVGNLPYSTTTPSLETHFAKLKPFTLRHRTDPKTKKSKGFAFLEFEAYDRMKTCLKLYHHSNFDPEAEENGGKGKGNGKGARRINVELTAGGGGKGEVRKEKVKVKNERLEGQRQRRAEAERKEGLRKERKAKGGDVEASAERDGEKLADVEAGQDTAGAMHPSRLARLQR